MTPREVKRLFFASIKEEMNSAAKCCADNVKFDNLWRLFKANDTFAYALFFPIHLGNGFQEVFRLYQKMHHDIDDDGDMSLVFANMEYQHPALDKKCETTDYFIVDKNHHDLEIEDIKKSVNYHLHQKIEHISYSACDLDWEGVKFLADIAEEYQEKRQQLKKESDEWDRQNVGKYRFESPICLKLFELDDYIEEKMLNMIKSHKFTVTKDKKEIK